MRNRRGLKRYVVYVFFRSQELYGCERLGVPARCPKEARAEAKDEFHAREFLAHSGRATPYRYEVCPTDGPLMTVYERKKNLGFAEARVENPRWPSWQRDRARMDAEADAALAEMVSASNEEEVFWP